MNKEFQTSFEDNAEVSSPVIFDLGHDSQGAGPVVKLVNTIINQAVSKKASDIHIEPREKNVIIRLRVDGILRELMTVPKQIHPSLASRVKIMAQMDIAEKRLPQDGRIQIYIQDRNIDLRISTLTTVFGEKIVIRILDKTNMLLHSAQLGFLDINRRRYQDIITSAYGMVLVTGPTGSGKTTSLYAALNELNNFEQNIITIEDPVEYILAGVNQIQVNARIGLDFAAGLRSILRQDPDIVMVGEIRDEETAKIAVRAATTGHLVLSTLHTNDAAGAVIRLMDMGVEPYLAASSMAGVIAQRLVRSICPHCRTPYWMEADDPARLFMKIPPEEPVQLFKGQGCSYCDDTGFKGRQAIQEVLLVTRKLRTLINGMQKGEELKAAAMAQGMVTLKEDGIAKALQGLTTIEEVIRVAYVDES